MSGAALGEDVGTQSGATTTATAATTAATTTTRIPGCGAAPGKGAQLPESHRCRTLLAQKKPSFAPRGLWLRRRSANNGV